jgi:hypothetical protein
MTGLVGRLRSAASQYIMTGLVGRLRSAAGQSSTTNTAALIPPLVDFR